MYSTVLILHSLFRWFVLLSLSYSILSGFRGYFLNKNFSSWDNKVRHWTATIAHIQLVLGTILYIKSPIIQYYFSSTNTSSPGGDFAFFTLIHPTVMMIALVVITIGSARAKRMNSDIKKFKTMLFWFSLALLLIFIAIPWPFSPLINRPYFRTF